MATREIEISYSETNHAIAREYATVFDNGLVQLRRNFKHKLVPVGATADESDTPNSSLTTEQIKKLAAEL